jgi:CRISPR system Cascade subunit CasD
MDYLLFRLYGSLASWGEIAVGETRHSASYPGKSAVIGLMGAALGVKRNDRDLQQRLQDGYHLAVEVFSRGNLLRDYHTTQVPDSVGKFSYRTRRDELVLGKSRLGTILSTREYRTDAMALVAVKSLPDAPFSLEEIKDHLLKPKFHLYLGRKSCPLAAPLHPQLILGRENFEEAFAAYGHKPLLPGHREEEGLSRDDLDWLGIGNVREYYWEGETSSFSSSFDLSKMQSRVRHDQPLSRRRWQFTPRLEHYFYQAGGE